MIGFARARIVVGPPMPGLFALRPRTTVAQAIDALLLVDFCSDQDEWQNRVEFLPLSLAAVRLTPHFSASHWPGGRRVNCPFGFQEILNHVRSFIRHLALLV